ncbi:MAG TPA: aminomethyltransferase family protein [Pyrinomonadaceae bacterium]|nr:aminomethyltransferase family protein [Pyrinomonadaceae bacterium]
MSEAAQELTVHKLPLEETHRQHGATFTEHDGWLLPAHYGDVREEYEAVRGVRGAGIIDLSARGRIEVSGAEAVQFLNGLITNDLKALAAGKWMHAAFPNAQGRLLASVRVMRPGEEEKFLIETEPVTHEKVFQTLHRFTFAGDFRVRDVTAETVQFSLQGAQAEAIIESVFGNSLLQRGPLEVVAFQWRETREVVCATHAEEGVYDLVCDSGGAQGLWEALTKAGARPVGQDAFEVLRVEAGVPRYGIDVSETNVVLEAVREDEAVSYTKGCYIGQEIIARIHWRGHVAKQLAGLVLDRDADLGADARVKTADGKEVGRITSHVFSPRLARPIALAILKYDYLQPGTEVRVVAGEAELPARVSQLPFVRGDWYAAPGTSSDGGETTT